MILGFSFWYCSHLNLACLSICTIINSKVSPILSSLHAARSLSQHRLRVLVQPICENCVFLLYALLPLCWKLMLEHALLKTILSLLLIIFLLFLLFPLFICDLAHDLHVRFILLFLFFFFKFLLMFHSLYDCIFSLLDKWFFKPVFKCPVTWFGFYLLLNSFMFFFLLLLILFGFYLMPLLFFPLNHLDSSCFSLHLFFMLLCHDRFFNISLCFSNEFLLQFYFMFLSANPLFMWYRLACPWLVMLIRTSHQSL